jgi:hypothetical protein
MGATHAPLIHPSSSIYNKKIDFKQKSVSDVTSKAPFCLKSIFLSKRGGQRGDEGRIFSISLNYFNRPQLYFNWCVNLNSKYVILFKQCLAYEIELGEDTLKEMKE